jgi:hypothetical protein
MTTVDMPQGGRSRLPPLGSFFMRDVHRKSFVQRSKSPTEYSKTEVVMADHARRTNYGMNNVGIGTCLNVGA